MAFERLERLEDEMEQLEQRSQSDPNAKRRRRLLTFSNRVYELIELAFDEVYNLLSEIANIRQSELNDETVSRFTKQLTDVHSGPRFKKVLKICDDLAVLADTYGSDIEAVLANQTGGYSELLFMLGKHERQFRQTIESAVSEIQQSLRTYRSGGDIAGAQKLADDARQELKSHIDRVHLALARLKGKTGGMDSLIEDRADTVLSRSAWLNGGFYLAVVIVLLSVLTFVSGQLELVRLAIVLVGTYVGLVLIGAFQLKNDDKLSEAGLLELVRLSLTRVLLPILKKAR